MGGNSFLDEVPAWQADSTQGNWLVAHTGSGTWNEQRLYTYDLRSHLASETYFPPSSGNALLSYQFDGNTAGGLGQPTTFDVNSGSSGSSVSTYDAVGQLSTHDPGANTDALVWDAFGRLVGLQRTGTSGFAWKAVYDGFGRRLQTTTVPSGSGITVLAQSSYDPEVQFLKLAVTINGQREWLVHGPDLTGGYGDLQGTGGIDAVVNPSASTATGIVSDVYGHVEATVSGTTVNWNPVLCVGYGAEPGLNAKPLDGTHDLSTFLAWRGKYVDPTGLYYLGNRYYDPQSGTFVSADPLGHASSMDLYQAFAGDPVNYFDPQGLVATAVANYGVGVGYGARADLGWVIDAADNSFYGTAAGAANIAATVDSAMASGFTDFSAAHSSWNQVAQAVGANAYPTERMGWYTNNEFTAGVQNAVSMVFPLIGGDFGPSTPPSAVPAATGALTLDDFLAQAQAKVAGVKAQYGGVEAYSMAAEIETTLQQLQGAANRAAQNVSDSSGPVYGTQVHTAFKTEVAALGNANLASEVSYLNGEVVPYGTPGSVRLDVVEYDASGNIKAVFDLKTGSASLTPSRIQQIKSHLPGGGVGVSVQEVRP